MCFGVLCVDEGSWDQDMKSMVTDHGTTYMCRCKGITREHLQAPQLKFTEFQAIRAAYRELVAASGQAGLVGLTADMGYLWLKHTASVRKIIDGATPVYLSPLVQLPMISACFKEFELSLLVTWDRNSERDSIKSTFIKDSSLAKSDMDRLEILGINNEDRDWKAFLQWETTHDQNAVLGERLAASIRDRLDAVNTAGKKDKLIKAVILTARLGVFSDALRETLGVPVFDDRTQMQFFASGRKLSHYHDGAVLARLNAKMRPGTGGEATMQGKAKLGLLQLDYHFPPTFGDLEHAGTLNFETIARKVKGLFFEVAQEGSLAPEILESLAATIRDIEAEDVMGLTGNCGFMMFYQCFARHIATVPVFMSSLIQASTLAASIDETERVLILTANEESLKPGKDKLLLDSGIHVTDSDRFVIYGLQDVPGFDAVALGERVDTVKVQTNLNRIIPELIDNERVNGPIKVILMECTELPHFADGLRKLTGLAVFDAVTNVNFFYNATAKCNWNTKTYTPHNVDYWNSHFDKRGQISRSDNLASSSAA